MRLDDRSQPDVPPLAARHAGRQRALRRSALVALLTGLLLSSLSLALPWAGVGVVVALGCPWRFTTPCCRHGCPSDLPITAKAVMGLLSTIFCLSNVLSAVGQPGLAERRGAGDAGAGGCAVAAWGLRALSVRPGTEAPSGIRRLIPLAWILPRLIRQA